MEHLLVPYEAARNLPADSVLILAPHPDDEVLGCGGTLLRHVQAKVPVRVIIATDGALGFEGAARERFAELRRAESRAAAALLGYGEPEFWNLPDQSLAYGEQLVRRILDAIGDADLVYAPSILEMHPDHRALGMAAAEAVRRAGGDLRLAFYEVGTPLKPNMLLDITGVSALKTAALQCFTSQLEKQRYDQHIAALNRYRTYTLPAEVTAAEAFMVASAQDLARDPFEIYRPEHQRQRALRLPVDSRDLPLVSVIIRSGDRPELRDALDSVALQTYSNIEVLVVDALGVHADLPKWCGRFPLRLVSRGEPLPRARAANIGLDEARGECLIFLDDDDLFLPDHLARLVETLRGGQDLAAYSGVRVEAENGLTDVYDSDFAPIRLVAWNHLPILGVLFERKLLQEGCRFDETLDLYEDWDFWLQVSRRSGFTRSAGVTAVYRAHLGRSAATQRDGEARLAQARKQVWRKWLDVLPPAEFETLLQDFRGRAAEDKHRLAVAAHAEGDLRDQLQAANAQTAALQKHMLQVHETLDAVRGSASWRITAPVRAFIQLFRRAA